MTTFSEQIDADLADVFFNNGEFAVPAVFNDGDAVNVLIDHDVLVQADGYEVGVATLGTTISALVKNVDTPSRGDTFLIDSTTYTVQRVDSNDGAVVKVVVK